MNKISDLVGRINMNFLSYIDKQFESVANEYLILKDFLENTQAAKLIRTKETTNAGRPIICYMYEMGDWTGIGNCHYFSIYVHNEILTGVEIMIGLPLENKQILNLYPEYRLMDTLEFDEIGFDAINYTYATFMSDILLCLTTEKGQPNQPVMVSFYKFNYVISKT